MAQQPPQGVLEVDSTHTYPLPQSGATKLQMSVKCLGGGGQGWRDTLPASFQDSGQLHGPLESGPVA